jgi:hypothetical protein
VADNPDYGRQAVNLARSIRLRDPNLPLAIATNLNPRLFRGIYDHIVPWRFDRWTGLLSKLDALEMSPFDATLFLDADVVAYESLEFLFEHFSGRCFGVVGESMTPNRWFKRMRLIRALIPNAGLLSFAGAAYYFEKGAAAEALFRRAKEWHARYDELEIRPYRIGRNEEPLFALAMFEAGMQAPVIRTSNGEITLLNPVAGAFDSNVIEGRCVRMRNGAPVNQMIMHFGGGWQSSYEYLQEEMRLYIHAAKAGRGKVMGGVSAAWAAGNYLVHSPRRILRLRAALSGIRKRWADRRAAAGGR